VTVERRDHQLGRLLEPHERLVGVQAEVVLELGIGLLEHPDVGAGAEELVPAPRSTITWTFGSIRAASTAESISSIISYE
jgi:hypothetical protein